MIVGNRVVVRKAREADVDQLYDLLKKSTGGKTLLTRTELRRDLSDAYHLNASRDALKSHDASFEIDIKEIEPNCAACQAFLAHADGVPVGYLIYHYFYSPWLGRLVFVDDVYVEEAYRRTGIGNKLTETLRDLCRSQNLVYILFNGTGMSSELLRACRTHGYSVVRSEESDWSVFRVFF